MHESIRVGIVDDQQLILTGLTAILNNWENFEVVFESENGYSVVERLTSTEHPPQVMLVDLSLPPNGQEEYSGIQLTLDLRKHFPDLKILILTVQDDPITTADLIEKGAHGFLSKNCSPDELRMAIVAVCNQGSYFNERTLDAIQKRLNNQLKVPKNDNALTNREVEILQLICQQFTAEEIGNRLFISPKTVNGHRNNLLQKTGSRNINGLVMYAIKHGFSEVI